MASCNAGHGCSIKCEGGCAAIYMNGKCTKWCEDKEAALDVLESGGIFSVDMHDIPLRHLRGLLGRHADEDLRKMLDDGERRITIKLESTDLEQFTRQVAAGLR